MQDVSLSVVIPAYNAEKFIAKALESLVSQTDKNFEIVLVDDGSDDNTSEIAESFLKSSGFEKYKIIRQDNKGVSVARNTGITSSIGDYIIFMDADDYVASDLVSTVKSLLKTYQRVDAIFWKYADVDVKGKLLNKFEYPEELSTDLTTYTGTEILETFLGLYKMLLLPVFTGAYSRRNLQEWNLYFNEKLICGEDQNFVYRYLLRSKRVLFLPKTLYFYVNRPNSSSRKVSLRRLDAYYAFKLLNEEVEAIITESEERETLTSIFREMAVRSFLSTLCVLSASYGTLDKVLDDLQRIYPSISVNIQDDLRKISKPRLARTGFEYLGTLIGKRSLKAFFTLCKAKNLMHSLLK